MNQTSLLVVNMNYLGDALMTTPAIRALKKFYPEARVDVIAGSTANYGALEILSLDPDIDRLIPRAHGGSFARGRQLFRVITTGSYELIVVLPTIPFYFYIAKMTGRRVYMAPKADTSKHMAEHMLTFVQSLLPGSCAQSSFVMQVPDQAIGHVGPILSALQTGRRLVVFNVGASRPQKRWPSDHFAVAAKLALAAGLNIALVGGDNEQDLLTASVVVTALANGGVPVDVRLIDLVGKTNLEQLAAVILAADVLVTADTGAMHIASALSIPQVALFGSTSAHFTGPYGAGSKNRILDLGLVCAPCGTHPTCNGRYDCMRGIQPEHVLQSILELMSIPDGVAAC